MKYTLSIILICLAPFSDAKEVCLPLTAAGDISMKLVTAEQEQVSKSKEVFSAFIKYAKKDDIKGIMSTYSKYDSSDASLQKALRQTPDKFSLYNAITKTTFGDSFKWGDYVVSLIEYEYQGQTARMVQGFFCTKYACQVSDVFDRPAVAEDQILRFFEQYRFSGWNGKTCPSKKTASFPVYPTASINKKINPLTVFINTPVEPLGKGKKLGIVKDFSDCKERLLKQKAQSPAKTESVVLMNDFVGTCSKNMDAYSLVPVVKVSDIDRLAYMTSDPFLNLFHDGEFTRLYQISDGQNDVSVYLVNTANGEKSLFLLPLIKSNGKSYFDWEYFGGGAAQSIMTPFFVQHLRNQFPLLFVGNS